MKYETYKLLRRADDWSKFSFTSVGSKGEINIGILFTETDDPNIAYLGFGNLLPDGSIDDSVKNANHDRDKILATVAMAVSEYTAAHPQKLIVFSGSTPSRTRLYRMAITVNFDELNDIYEIYGLYLTGFKLTIEKFKKNRSYYAFAVKRKPINLFL